VAPLYSSKPPHDLRRQDGESSSLVGHPRSEQRFNSILEKGCMESKEREDAVKCVTVRRFEEPLDSSPATPKGGSGSL
jgi:hypothetical protein